MRDRAFKHGSRALAELLRRNAVDGRTSIGLMLRDVRERLAADAGGWDALTERERILVEDTANIYLITQSIANYAFSQKTVLNEAGQLLPVLANNYLSYANVLRLNLDKLGLKPPKPDGEGSLDAYLKSKRPQPQDSPEEVTA